jgi:DNA-directed RNA polymerase subunit RPC12/RpoP
MDNTCSSCGFVNLDWARRCSQCGADLGQDEVRTAVVLPGDQEEPPPEKRCPECGFVNLDWARQCSGCGSALPGVHEHRPVVGPQDDDDRVYDLDLPPPSPYGIGGWLILPIIHLFGVAVTSGLMCIVLLSADTGAYGLFFAFANAVFAVAAVLLLMRLFLMSRELPKLMIYFYLGIAAFSFIDLLWTSSAITGSSLVADIVVGNLLRNLLFAAIWVPYFSASRRVQNTFTR